MLHHISFLLLLFSTVSILLLKSSFYYCFPQKNTSHLFQRNPKDIEGIFIDYTLSGKINNSICSLEKSKKIMLCLQIYLQLTLSDNSDIKLNKVAFFINSAKCEKKPVRFVQKVFFIEEIIMQDMYPCYGRTDPVRTNFITDDNYDKFYVSNGWTDDSIFLYIHEFDTKSDRYIIHNHYIDFQLTALTDIFISIEEVANELKMNHKIVLTSQPKEVELIYLREKENPEQEDKICKLDTHKKVAICSLIFKESAFHENYLEIEEHGFFIFREISIKRKIIIISDSNIKNISTSQRMIPCFSKNLKERGNIVTNKFFNFIYISEGSRPNSVFVYIKRSDYDEKDVILLKLVENIFIDNVTTYTDKKHQLPVTQSQRIMSTHRYVTTMSSLLSIKDSYKEYQLILEKENLSRILKIRKQLELVKQNSSSEKKKLSKSNLLDAMFPKLESRILVIANREVEDRVKKDNIVRKKYMKLDYVRLKKENYIMQRQVHRLIQTSKLNDTIRKIKHLDLFLENIQL